MDDAERDHMRHLKRSLDELITQMGGTFLKDGYKDCATFWVFYQDCPKAKQINVQVPTITKIKFEFITECYWSCGLLDPLSFEIKSN